MISKNIQSGINITDKFSLIQLEQISKIEIHVRLRQPDKNITLYLKSKWEVWLNVLGINQGC